MPVLRALYIHTGMVPDPIIQRTGKSGMAISIRSRMSIMKRKTKGDDELCMAKPFQAVVAVHGVLRRHEPPEFMIRTVFSRVFWFVSVA